MDAQVVFEYTLHASRGSDCSQVTVTEDGMVSFWYAEGAVLGLPRETDTIRVNGFTLDKIRKALDFVESEETETLDGDVMDGYENHFLIRNRHGLLDITIDNAACYRKEAKSEGKAYPNVMKLIGMLERIRRILVPLGVDSVCFSLSRR